MLTELKPRWPTQLAKDLLYAIKSRSFTFSVMKNNEEEYTTS